MSKNTWDISQALSPKILVEFNKCHHLEMKGASDKTNNPCVCLAYSNRARCLWCASADHCMRGLWWWLCAPDEWTSLALYRELCSLEIWPVIMDTFAQRMVLCFSGTFVAGLCCVSTHISLYAHLRAAVKGKRRRGVGSKVT